MKKIICTITLFANVFFGQIVLPVREILADITTFTQVGSQDLSAGSLSYTTSFSTSTQNLYLAYISVNFSAAPASSETIQVSIKSRNGTNFNPVLVKTATVAGTTTSVTLLFNGGIPIGGNDQVTVTCTNVSVARTAYVTVAADYTARQGYGVTIIKDGAFSTVYMPGGGSVGTVTSVDATSGTGLAFSGGPITGSGVLSLAGTLGVANGGTNNTAATDDAILVGNGSTFQLKVVGDCQDTSGKHINYIASSNTWTCGTSLGSGARTVMMGGGTGVTLVATSSYFPLYGSRTAAADTLPTAIGLTFPVSGTAGNLYCLTSVPPGATDVLTFSLHRAASSNTALTCNISGAVNTTCQDNTHTVSITAGDTLEYQVTTTGTSATVITTCGLTYIS